ncbi:MAG: putative MAPEG superfamily protein [Myxococcota bacterium]|jgi:uncharacterized MAPEG superfamily protein
MNAIHYLAATVAMTSLFWLPYVLQRMVQIGIINTLNNPSEESPDPPPWAQRAAAAHKNAIENLVMFVPAVGIAVSMGKADTALVTGAAAIYLVARALHYTVYTAGIPGLRTLGFLSGWAATLVVLYGSFQ